MRLGVAEIPAATLHLFTHTKNNIAMLYDALRKHDLGIFLEFSLKEKFVQSQLVMQVICKADLLKLKLKLIQLLKYSFKNHFLYFRLVKQIFWTEKPLLRLF